MTIGNWDAWNFRPQPGEAWPLTQSLVGFTVHASDGDIGSVADASTAENASWIAVDTGPWIFGRRVALPAGTIQRVDWDNETIGLDITKAEVKNSPPPGSEFSDISDEEYRSQLGAYYGAVRSPQHPIHPDD